jgi:hypothetical protein
MTQRSLQRTAAAAVLAMVLALAAPAHAAGRHAQTAAPGWMGTVLRWVTQLWPAAPAGSGLKTPGLKADQGIGIDPDGARARLQPSSSNGGISVDPNG